MNEEDLNQKETIANFDIRSFFKQWPWLYYAVATIFGPMMFCRLSSKKFLKKYNREGKTLNLGSGPRSIGDGVINVDIHPYPTVGIVANVLSVPLPDGNVARIVSDNVFEHVTQPQQAVKEMERLLEVGGLIYFSTPFLYPFHSSPNDYQRWTRQGLEQLFCDFEIIEIGVRAGPFSALTVYLNHLFAIIFSFGSRRLESILVNLVMFVTFPIKLLDLIFNYWPHADEMAAVLYLVARKK